MVLSIVCLVFLLCNSCALVHSLNDEGLALLSFKESLEEGSNGSLHNWNSSDPNPCSWLGITCRESKVVFLTLAQKELVGRIHPALGNLSALRHVSLRNNKLFGSLPVQLFEAKRLQSLVLSGNSLSGPIPPQIEKLRNLQTLDISNNSFNGTIPPYLLRCKRLKTLVLSQNSFTGSLPRGFGTCLIALQTLDLSFNGLNGSIPGDMGNLSSLNRTLDLSHNNFSGPIPPSLGSLPEQVYIDLSYNNLGGCIPQIGSLENLGPTAFKGNPSLSGFPLKIPCSPIIPDLILPRLPDPPSHNSGHLGTVAVISIAVGVLVGIGLIGFLFSSYYQNVSAHKEDDDLSGRNSEKGSMEMKEYFCFGNGFSETLSEKAEQHHFVPLDSQVDFNLEDLLKADAFVLGKSIFGIVYKVVLNNGATLAVRRLGEGGFQRFKDFRTEVEAIGKIRHPNIVPLRAYSWSVGEKLLIYDYIPNGDLATVLHGKSGSVSCLPLLWHIRMRIMKGIATGLAYLHEFGPKKYVHGDLKPSNVLLGPDMEAYVSDFGLGHLADTSGGSPILRYRRMASETPEQNSPYEFTTLNYTISLGSYYQAPEALKVPKPLQKWDVYSYGVILLEMITGKSPTIQEGSSGRDLVRWIQLCIEEKKTLPDILDPSLVRYLGTEEEIVGALKLALACTRESPEKRPSMRQVCDALDRLATSTDFCLY
ncbi:hypothetical protein L1049_002352 [Liquidambar formosana]|uniref:Protein kinase domain-containing protein n=1 Tax=Liquidambar formosana TaxID=63359 RepID=A0AAP0NFH5_LIQFO